MHSGPRAGFEPDSYSDGDLDLSRPDSELTQSKSGSRSGPLSTTAGMPADVADPRGCLVEGLLSRASCVTPWCSHGPVGRLFQRLIAGRRTPSSANADEGGDMSGHHTRISLFISHWSLFSCQWT